MEKGCLIPPHPSKNRVFAKRGFPIATGGVEPPPHPHPWGRSGLGDGQGATSRSPSAVARSRTQPCAAFGQGAIACIWPRRLRPASPCSPRIESASQASPRRTRTSRPRGSPSGGSPDVSCWKNSTSNASVNHGLNRIPVVRHTHRGGCGAGSGPTASGRGMGTSSASCTGPVLRGRPPPLLLAIAFGGVG